MKLTTFLGILIALLITGCKSDDFFENNKDAFYKLYGNGTIQEAVAMRLHEEGDVFIVGNQYVRNQDSSALLIIRAGSDGNQRWSGNFFGKGYSTAKAMLLLPDNELLVLASSRETGQAASVPVLYKLDLEGNLLQEFFPGQEENSNNSSTNRVPEDMVLGEGGSVFLLGNIRGAGGRIEKSFIQKVDLHSGKLLDQREFNDAAMTGSLGIMRNGNQLLVLGETSQEVGDIQQQSIFMASYSSHLIEAGHTLIGSTENDYFRKAILSSMQELVILSSVQSPGKEEVRGMLHFMRPGTMAIRKMAYLDYNEREIPEAIGEDDEGNFYLALTTFGERGNSNILINKIDPYGVALWESPLEIGGEGNDKIAQVEFKNRYVYLLKTIDMQNENTLISLSKIRF